MYHASPGRSTSSPAKFRNIFYHVGFHVSKGVYNAPCEFSRQLHTWTRVRKKVRRGSGSSHWRTIHEKWITSTCFQSNFIRCNDILGISNRWIQVKFEVIITVLENRSLRFIFGGFVVLISTTKLQSMSFIGPLMMKIHRLHTGIMYHSLWRFGGEYTRKNEQHWWNLRS